MTPFGKREPVSQVPKERLALSNHQNLGKQSFGAGANPVTEAGIPPAAAPAILPAEHSQL